MNPSVVAKVQDRLSAIARDHAVALPLAIESGSRAWGFPSPDSDYDCRFIYVRRPDDYLDLWPHRDVIETPLDAVFDVNGWDLGKALKLLVKGNAVVVEWLTSPIAYREDTAFRQALLDLASAVVQRPLVARHYLSLLKAQMAGMADPDAPTAVKKLFYVLRPAAALRWLRLNPGIAVAPMHFPTLIAQADIDAGLSRTIARMLEQKAQTREMGQAPVPADVRRFINAESLAAESLCVEPLSIPQADARRLSNACFGRWVHIFGQQGSG